MPSATLDRTFAGSIPELYERYLVPLIFEPYAVDLAERVRRLQPRAVLEIAAGTGVVTRSLARALPASVTIVAADLNEPMLRHAEYRGTARPVEWRTADALCLPFVDSSFDVVVCQFGVMFFPDRAAAHREVRRVLRDRGSFVFNVWDRIEDNEFADVVTESLAASFDDPPTFLRRIPHGYCDRGAITSDLAQGGFERPPQLTTLAARSRAESAEAVAIAYCQGTPLRNEIEARNAISLERATGIAAAAIEARFGRGPVDAKVQATIVEIAR
ncbi:MAG TPA: methyltransferase domain-containing protein [Burkholderiaceae bacterium]|nr:methyltransferase domain-containing protein [Burkholderiaceae bacterium]